MANELQVFNNEDFGKVRTVNIDGEPWFVGKDVAGALGYTETAKAIRTHIDDEDKGVSILDTPGGKQKITVINESGLYSLILSSKLPTAKKFRRWITSEVIPAVVKTGTYTNPQWRPQEVLDDVVINNHHLKVMEWNRERVIPLRTFDKLYGCMEGMSLKTFNECGNFFVPNIDYFSISSEDMKEYFNEKSDGIVVLTKVGCTMLTKLMYNRSYVQAADTMAAAA